MTSPRRVPLRVAAEHLAATRRGARHPQGNTLSRQLRTCTRRCLVHPAGVTAWAGIRHCVSRPEDGPAPWGVGRAGSLASGTSRLADLWPILVGGVYRGVPHPGGRARGRRRPNRDVDRCGLAPIISILRQNDGCAAEGLGLTSWQRSP